MTPAWKIDQQQMDDLINSWINCYDVFAPVRKGNQFVFSQIKTAAEAVLDYDTTILPPRKYFLPQREVLFEYARPGAEAVQACPSFNPGHRRLNLYASKGTASFVKRDLDGRNVTWADIVNGYVRRGEIAGVF